MKKILIAVAAVGLFAGIMRAQASGQTPAGPGAKPNAAAQAQPGQAAQPAQPAAPRGPQPKSKEEYDAFMKLQAPGLTPDQRIEAAEEFLVKYPQTELKTFAYSIEMQSYSQKNDFPNMQAAGEKVLALDPGNVMVLTILANVAPERILENDLNKDEKMKKADEYQTRALAAIDKLQKPNPAITDADFDKLKNDARGQVYEGMAVLSMKRKNYPQAIDNLKKAESLRAQKEPMLYWHLGQAYAAANQLEPARDAFKMAVSLGGVKTASGRDLASENLKAVEDALAKKQGGTPSNAAPAPPAAAAPAAPKP